MHRYDPRAFPAFGFALAAALLVTPLVRRLALKFALIDHPSDRKLHASPVPNLGGGAVVFAFLLSLAAEGFGSMPDFGRAEWSILAGGSAVAAMGFWDDRRVLPGWVKVPIVLALGLIVYRAGARADLLGPWPLDLVLTMGWVIGITNAINYMDNMDGLGPGLAAITGGSLAVLAGLSGQIVLAAVAAALAGSALGFAWHNRPPARIFLGDGGSLFFGFILAGLGLDLRIPHLRAAGFLVPVVVMALPILDALMVSVSRILRGMSPLHPGKDHISHRLVASGAPPARAVELLLITAAADSAVAILMARSGIGFAYLMFALVCLAGFVMGAVLLKAGP